MIVLAALAAQMLSPARIPAEMEAATDPYVKCVHQRFASDIERLAGNSGQTEVDGSAIMSKAIGACSDARSLAITSSEGALRRARGFEDPERRRAFVRERIDELDALMRWSVRPEGDPDNWNPDAED